MSTQRVPLKSPLRSTLRVPLESAFLARTTNRPILFLHLRGHFASADQAETRRSTHSQRRAQSRRRRGRGQPSPGADVAGATKSWRRCGRGQPSPGPDVAGVSPAAVAVRIWDRWAKCWCTGVNEAVGAAGCSLPPALSRLYRYPPPPCTLASSAPQSQRSVACGARANGSLFRGWTAQRCSIVSTVSTVSTAAV